MFNRIPSDVLEIVVVYSRSYDLFIELKEIVEKFKDNQVETRVRDKLTEKCVVEYGIQFVLHNKSNREYNKPCYLSSKDQFALSHYYLYERNKDRLNIDLPYSVCLKGLRMYNSRVIDVKGCGSYLYRIGKKYFFESGCRHVDMEMVNILKL